MAAKEFLAGFTPLFWVTVAIVVAVVAIGYYHFFVATWTPYEQPATMVTVPTTVVQEEVHGHPTPRPFFAQPERTTVRPSQKPTPATTPTLIILPTIPPRPAPTPTPKEIIVVKPPEGDPSGSYSTCNPQPFIAELTQVLRPSVTIPPNQVKRTENRTWVNTTA